MRTSYSNKVTYSFWQGGREFQQLQGWGLSLTGSASLPYKIISHCTLNSEASYDIRLRDCHAVRRILVVELHHELRRVDLAVLLRNVWQVEFPQKVLLHGSQEVLHVRVHVFLLQKSLLWQLRVKSLRVPSLNVIIERLTGAGASRNHQTQTQLEQECSWVLHFEMRLFLLRRAGANFTFFPARKQTLRWQGLKMEIPNARTTVLMSAPMLPE